MSKNSYNNPAYYILEGVPNQSAAAVSPELLPSPTSAHPAGAKAPPPSARSKPPYVPSGPCSRRPGTGHPVCAINEEGSSEDDGGAPGATGNTLNRPPPDFPPPPLPKGALEMVLEPPFSKARPVYPDLSDVRVPAAAPAAPLAAGESFRRGGGALDDQSCSVLQMAKSLSESEFQGQPPRASSAPPPVRGQPLALGLDASCSFPPRHTITESIAEDLPEEVRALSWRRRSVCRGGLHLSWTNGGLKVVDTSATSRRFRSWRLGAGPPGRGWRPGSFTMFPVAQGRRRWLG